jgi:hypothetical protein
MGNDSLFGAEVVRVLAGLLDSAPAVAVSENLRRRFGPDLGRRIATLHSLQHRAKSRFGNDLPPFLTEAGLEQATHPRLASHRSDVIDSQIGHSRVWDATCGVGVDGRALARGGHTVVLGDRDAFTVRCARANLEHDGRRAWAVRADATTRAVDADVLLLDPDRRVGGKRSLDPEAWSPSLSAAVRAAEAYPAACLKLAPAIDPTLLPPWPADWVSVDGNLSEVTLWAGRLATRDPRVRAVVALRGDAPPARFEAVPERVEAWSPEQAAEVPWLVVPDKGLLRSDLLGALANAEGLRPLAPRLAWLGGERPPTSPLLAGFPVLASCTLDRKRVRAMLGEHDVGPIAVRKRGHPDPAEILERRFQGPGRRRATLAVGRLERGHRAWLLGPVQEPGDAPPGPFRLDPGPIR